MALYWAFFPHAKLQPAQVRLDGAVVVRLHLGSSMTCSQWRHSFLCRTQWRLISYRPSTLPRHSKRTINKQTSTCSILIHSATTDAILAIESVVEQYSKKGVLAILVEWTEKSQNITERLSRQSCICVYQVQSCLQSETRNLILFRRMEKNAKNRPRPFKQLVA